jgi:predicted phage baseplate assembly protein
MPLPDANLDDLRFQDLVDEARKRVARYAPEWTEFNVSDPGVALIELLAWMTELTVYRLNRVPDKNYVRFLNLLGVQLKPARSAYAMLTFRLAAPLPLGPESQTQVVIPRGLEVSTQETPNAPQVTFTVDENYTVVPPVVTHLVSPVQFNRNYVNLVEAFVAFANDPPQPGAYFYIGIDAPAELKGHILRLDFNCERSEAYGVRRDRPPLKWHVSAGNGAWLDIEPSRLEGERDTTGGLNNEQGSMTFYLPQGTLSETITGVRRTWIRCTYAPPENERNAYTQSPRIFKVAAYAAGGETRATHAIYRQPEQLGVSTGDAGQIFHLQRAPILDLSIDESVEVEETRDGELVFVPWQRVEDFSASSIWDRHYVLDTSTGEVRFGPAVRQQNGSMRTYGRVPEVGRRIRISGYRTGGGAVGNVPVNRLTIMRTAVPYVDRVTNRRRAEDGMDAETLEEAQMRARRELRAQNRAVSAEDYESLARSASPFVARAKCMTPMNAAGQLRPGELEVLLVPAQYEAVARGDFAALRLTPEVERSVRSYLDRMRLLTTTLYLREAAYVGVKVIARIVPSDVVTDDRVIDRVNQALRSFLAPLPPEPPFGGGAAQANTAGGAAAAQAAQEAVSAAAVAGSPSAGIQTAGSSSGRRGLAARGGAPLSSSFGRVEMSAESELVEPWEGWPSGKPLYVAELFSLIQGVRGVKHVLEVKVLSRPLELGRLEAGVEALGAVEPQPLVGNVLQIGPGALLCSLNHEIQVERL